MLSCRALKQSCFLEEGTGAYACLKLQGYSTPTHLMQRPNKMNLQRRTAAAPLKETGKLVSTNPQCSYCSGGVAGLRSAPLRIVRCQAGCSEQQWILPHPGLCTPKGRAHQLFGVKRLLFQLPSYVLLTPVKVILFQHYVSYLLPTCRHVNDFDLV